MPVDGQPQDPLSAPVGAAREWRANWSMVVASFVGMATVSIHAFSLGVMVAPIEQEFGWTREQIFYGPLILTAVGILFNIPMGALVDKLGSRPIALTGILTYLTAIALLSQATGSIWVWLLLWFFVALGQLQLKPTTWVAAITALFDKGRGLALAVVLSGTGVATSLLPIVATGLVAEYGWRTAYLVLAGGWGILAFPIVFFLFRKKPTPHEAAQGNVKVDRSKLPGLTVKEGLTSGPFWKMAIAVMAMAMASTGIVLNLVPIFASYNYSVTDAAALAGMAGAAAMVGRLSSGVLLDHFDARIVSGVAVFLPAVACGLLLAIPAPFAWAALAVIILGLATGAEIDAISYMAGRFFGMRNLGTLFGALMSSMTVGVGLGPVLASRAYDLTGSYDQMLWAVIPLSILASILFLMAGRYPDFAKRAETGQ